MPFRSYSGPATLVIDAREESVTVQLEARRDAEGEQTWGGQLRAARELLWDAMVGRDLRLRIEHQEGLVTIVGHTIMSGAASIRGHGPAPI